MSNKSRMRLLQKVAHELEMEKKAQEIVDTTKSNAEGEKIADEIFDKIVDSITLEELEKEVG